MIYDLVLSQVSSAGTCISKSSDNVHRPLEHTVKPLLVDEVQKSHNDSVFILVSE